MTKPKPKPRPAEPATTEAAKVARAILKARETPPVNDDVASMRASLDRNRARGPRVTAMVANLPDAEGRNSVWVGAPHNDAQGWLIRLQDACGTHSDEFARQQLHVMTNMAAKPTDESGSKIDEQAVNGMLAAVDGVRPRDEAEGMLAVQMATTHAYAMDCMMRAHRATTIPQMEASGNLAVKLLRTYTAQIEALAKLRRGGEQRVEVKHVHVHEGGQAIVGNVSHGGRSIGSAVETHDTPPPPALDARALAFAPGTPLWSPEPGREPVPVAGGDG